MTRNRWRHSLLVSALCLAAPCAAWAQSAMHHAHQAAAEAEIAEFLAHGRAATARYRDRSVAIADGYRLLGPDFPAMGEHWINPGLLLDGRFDAAQPAVLSYATFDGRPTLLGVAYAFPLGPGEAPPPFPGHGWHDHVGSIDEESVLLNHIVSGHGHQPGVRVAMLHAWLWLENPAGVFESDNWALPFTRLGLEVPAAFPTGAAKALSLASGSDLYYLMLLRALAQPTTAEETAAQELLTRYRGLVEAWLSARPSPQSLLSAAELAEVSTLWTELWRQIDSRLRPAAALRLRPIWEEASAP